MQGVSTHFAGALFNRVWAVKIEPRPFLWFLITLPYRSVSLQSFPMRRASRSIVIQCDAVGAEVARYLVEFERKPEVRCMGLVRCVASFGVL